jgi:hypothetical protein
MSVTPRLVSVEPVAGAGDGGSGGSRARFDTVKRGHDFPALAEQVMIGLEPQP